MSMSDALARLRDGASYAPFDVLGRHEHGADVHVRVWLPPAVEVRFEHGPMLGHGAPDGVFEWRGAAVVVPRHYRIVWRDRSGHSHTDHDAYSFPVRIDERDAYYFNEGTHRRLYDVLGAQWMTIDGIAGVRFAVWAPNAERVGVVGDWNGWDGLRHPLQSQGASGLWALFIPDLAPGARYKFEIRNRQTGAIVQKADPFARAFEHRPNSASVLVAPTNHSWGDAQWLAERAERQSSSRPIAIYEVHLGSWQRAADGAFLDYRTIAMRLAEHVTRLGFTHVELLPITEHPFDGSWGYQTLGYFAPTSRFGSPDDLRWFVDHLHQRGVGVILDWVPAHFPFDPHGLAHFDGTALYEHADPRLGLHRDWDTAIFNYGRNEVRNFLIASALFWLREFHVDGLRVDAVASMLYLDYSRKPGEWLPNRYGGRENLDAIALLKQLNDLVHEECPGAITIAEESTSWPRVTGATSDGGLGFTFKWNMGWMHDTLVYVKHDPVHRSHHHDKLTFGMLYAYSERFVLPFSHDEVVHGKSSLLGKMPGDDWQKLANLRLLYTYLWTYPGKKLLFMGGELGQWREWDHDRQLDWQLLEHAPHRGLETLVKDLNRLYASEPAFWLDHDAGGFEWLDCDDKPHSVLAFRRRSGGVEVVVVLNFTPVPRKGYRLGVPTAGQWVELINSDSAYYGGTNVGNAGPQTTSRRGAMGMPQSMVVTLPPLAGLVFKRES
jgi:1,4-alpha-glucan branching enzyme